MGYKMKYLDELTQPSSMSRLKEALDSNIKMHDAVAEYMKDKVSVHIAVKKPTAYMKKKYGWREAEERAVYNHLKHKYA